MSQITYIPRLSTSHLSSLCSFKAGKSDSDSRGLFLPQTETQIAVPPISPVFLLSHKPLTTQIETSLLCEKDIGKKKHRHQQKKIKIKTKKAAGAVSQCLPATPRPAQRLPAITAAQRRHSRHQRSRVLLGTGQDKPLQLKAAFCIN